jgi:hypothetical protein
MMLLGNIEGLQTSVAGRVKADTIALVSESFGLPAFTDY